MPENLKERLGKVVDVLHWLGKYEEANAIIVLMNASDKQLSSCSTAKELDRAIFRGICQAIFSEESEAKDADAK